ncbi:unnamed protein product [Clavelina lepadiformis]|uniref:Cytochrome P450 n=1 Tax=Clavelina lepadiformis TaxID=159417 RepID=A0ABP0FI94_CLALP
MMLNYVAQALSKPIVLLLLGAVTLLYYWYKRPSRFPPGPRGIPVVGVLPFASAGAEKAALKWSKEYGPIMSMRMASTDWVVLNDYDSMRKAFVEQSTKFSGRPLIPLLNQYNKGLGLGSVDYGDFFKVQKSFGIKIMRGSGLEGDSIEDRIVEESDHLVDAVQAQNEKVFVPQVALRKAVINVICGVTFGKRFDYDDESFKQLLKAVIDTSFLHSFPSLAVRLMGLAPSLMGIPPFSWVNSRLLEKYRILNEIIEKIVDSEKEAKGGGSAMGFVGAYFKQLEAGAPHFNKEQLLQYTRELFNAGMENTAGTLAWGLLCLIHFPQTQRKLREEINAVVGPKDKIDLSLKAKLPYTNAFIQELTRFRSMTPFTVPHKTNEDAVIDSYKVPEGYTVLGNVWGVHNDPDYWNEPEKFDPERFIDNRGRFVKSDHVIPFGMGPRECLGKPVAEMVVFIMLVAMVRRFEFFPDPQEAELPPDDAGAQGAFFIPFPYELVAIEI